MPSPTMGTALLSASSPYPESVLVGSARCMRIGYSMWGLLGHDVVDTPDGSHVYRRPFIDGLITAGRAVVSFQPDRNLIEGEQTPRGRYRSDPDFADLGGMDGCSQFDRVLALLRDDPDTKRATMLIMWTDELADPANPCVACTLGPQFMLHARQLHLIANLRRRDAVIGLYGDTVAFTFIQEFAARLLGVEVGSYAHHVGSMHINAVDIGEVERIFAESELPGFGHAATSSQTSRAGLRTVLAREERLRRDQAACTTGAVERDPYWVQVIGLLKVHRQLTHHPYQPVIPEALALLRPGHRWLIEPRWPDRMPAGVTP